MTTTWREPGPSRIRACRRDDLRNVGALWMRAYRKGDGPAPEPFVAGLHRVFFDGPFSALRVAPLVLDNPNGGLVGFIGLMPRRLDFHGKPIVAAVATQLIVDRSANGFAAFELLRAALAGPQDLTFSDGANTLAQSIWQRLSGDVALVHSLEWLRVLRPAAYVAYRIERAKKPWASAILGGPLTRSVDNLLARAPLSALRPPRATRTTTPATAAELWALREAEHVALRARPTLIELEWLLARAGETQKHGPMRARVVPGPRGESAGWFIYYAMRGGLAQVVQLGGRRQALGDVLDALLADAFEHGCVAVTGQGEPRLLRELDDRHAIFTCPSLGALIHSGNRDLVAAVHRGDVSLSRLDGEWWLPFAELADGAATLALRPALGVAERAGRRAAAQAGS
jgi:hypothetical protein